MNSQLSAIDSYNVVWFAIGIIFWFCLYMAPSFVAALRKHKNGAAICALNLLLGWTGIGWILSLVWALTKV